MDVDEQIEALRLREAPLQMQSDEFRRLGHQLVEQIADFLASLPVRPVTPGDSTQVVRVVLGESGLPLEGTAPETILEEAARLLFEHSLFNGHPRFWGYISASPAPI